MSPESFANLVERQIRESYTDGDYEVTVRTDVGRIGIYLPPESMVHDVIIDEKYRQMELAKSALERATEVLLDLGETSVRSTIRQTHKPHISYENIELPETKDPTYKLLSSVGYSSIREVESSISEDEFMFEAVYHH